ncbi:MAG TPA: thioredoxin family protein [Hyphomonadaceae bacterium]|nr:thioredoxin family protein [Hyphomonadaceae bacterium]HPN07527.1 thioredoxin family protein [Hyphomonadaceae bacterium]
MKRLLASVAFAMAGVSVIAAPVLAEKPAKVAVRQDIYHLTITYDPKRDATSDLASAIKAAKASGKNVLLDVGGEWCSWCHILDNYLARNKEVGDAFAASFVILKINWSPDNKNAAFLAAYPAAAGYPHFYVLDANGKLLHSQDTAKLEQGEGYNKSHMLDFAKTWRAKPAA